MLTRPLPKFNIKYGLWKLTKQLRAFAVFAMWRSAAQTEKKRPKHLIKVPLKMQISSASEWTEPPLPAPTLVQAAAFCTLLDTASP